MGSNMSNEARVNSMISKMISHYKILERITRTEWEVYLAEDTRFGRKVVLKIFSEISDESHAREVFKREAIVASLVDHPNIRSVYGVDEYEGYPFIVMEHLEGTTLETRLAKGRLELKKILEISIQIAEALDEIHSKGIIHRNINPANIFLTVEGQAKLCDFALSTTLEAEQTKENDQQVAGTIEYISPERLTGKPAGTGSDIFSFGAVIYEMATGVRPFQKETVEETTHAVLKNRPTRISKYRNKVPRLLKKTIAEMLAKDPTKRLSSAQELQARLEQVRSQLEGP
jgi:serine/threonine protein kinase